MTKAKDLTDRGINAGVSADGLAIRRHGETVHVDGLHLDK
jgi:hypothetical protein